MDELQLWSYPHCRDVDECLMLKTGNTNHASEAWPVGAKSILDAIHDRVVIKCSITCIVTAFIVGLVAYASRYVTTGFSHDSLYIINDQAHVDAQIGRGRWLQPMPWLIRGRINAPRLLGVISLL